jgi:hypothetical protein
MSPHLEILPFLLIVLTTIIIALYKRKAVFNSNALWMLVYLILIFSSELPGYITGFILHKPNNVFLFNITLPLILLSCNLFFYSLFKKTNLKYIYITCSVLFAIILIVLIRNTGLSEFNSIAYFAATIFISASAITYFFFLFIYPDEKDILKDPAFYFCTGLLIAYSFLMVFTGLYSYQLNKFIGLQTILGVFKIIVNYLCYLSILYGFICLKIPKV